VLRWSELYLGTFGRGSFFQPARVQKIFRELTEIFISCLQERDLEVYFEILREKGCQFAALGVPFEELIISLHLFEEVCLEKFLELYPDRSKLSNAILAMEGLHSEGLAVLASSYFETAKKEMQKITEGLKEENEELKTELGDLKNSFFTHTQKELSTMQLVVTGINKKLKNQVYQLSRIQKMADALEGESQISKLLKIASTQFLSICPQNSQVFFALFDEERRRVNFYGREEGAEIGCDILTSFYFSELSKAFQEALYDEKVKYAYFHGHREIPPNLLELSFLKNQLEFLLIPTRKFQEVTGFVLLGSPLGDFFSKRNFKFYQRVGGVFSKALVNASLFNKSKKQDEFAFFLNEFQKRKFGGQAFETNLDFCLGSLIELLSAERSSLMLYDESVDELKVIAAKGYKVYPISGLSIKLGEGIAGLSLKEARVFSITKMKEPENPQGFSQFFKRKESPQAKIKSLLCLPLFDREKPLGVINVSTINFHKNFEKSEIEMAKELTKRITPLLKDILPGIFPTDKP